MRCEARPACSQSDPAVRLLPHGRGAAPLPPLPLHCRCPTATLPCSAARCAMGAALGPASQHRGLVPRGRAVSIAWRFPVYLGCLWSWFSTLSGVFVEWAFSSLSGVFVELAFWVPAGLPAAARLTALACMFRSVYASQCSASRRLPAAVRGLLLMDVPWALTPGACLHPPRALHSFLVPMNSRPAPKRAGGKLLN